MKNISSKPRQLGEMYIVQYSVGDWDSYTVNIFVTENEEYAKAYVEKFRTKLKKWKNHYEKMFGVDSDWLYSEGGSESKHYNRFCQIIEINNAYYLKIKVR